MRKRDLLLVIGFMACFTAALGSLVIMQIQGQIRSEENVNRICAYLQTRDGRPCDLLQPSETETRVFGFIRRR